MQNKLGLLNIRLKLNFYNKYKFIMKLKTFWFNAINFVFRRERPNIYQYI